MISRLGLRISEVFRRTAPDPFVIALLLTALTAVLALTLGFRAEAGQAPLTLGQKVVRLLDIWGVDGGRPAGPAGIWGLLGFGMQMCLVLVTGHAVAASRPMRRVIDAAAGLPHTAAGAAALIAVMACGFAVINWGLGLIVGAIMAREVGRSMGRRGVRVHYPLLAAAGYTGLMVWHGGLSGSAPLTSTTWTMARTVLPAAKVDEIAARVGGEGIDLSRTLASPLNLFVTGGLLVLTPLVCWVLAPRNPADMRPMSASAGAAPAPEGGAEDLAGEEGRFPRWIETTPWVAWGLALVLVAAMVRFGRTRGGLATISPNEVNAVMLAVGLILHGSVRSYLSAVEEGARGCAGIILQFPLYAGIMAMMQHSGLVRVFADAFVAYGDERTIPLFSFWAACVVNLFVPSGGGQWAVQGPIALTAGLDAGIDPGKMVMTVAYGDELTNMLQPFWALPLLAITGVRARDIVGYTAIVMLVAGAWISLGLLIF